MKSVDLTAVIIAKNEAEMLGACLKTLVWCSEVVVVDDNSTDETREIAKKHGAKLVPFSNPSFAELRNHALKQVKTNWLFYIDADERVTPQLAAEIAKEIATAEVSALSMKRDNFFFGTQFSHGGWQEDTVTRIFKASALQEWRGKIHESPVFSGTAKTLKNSLIHFSHRSIVSGLFKSASWTPMEAELLYKAGIAPVGVMTVLRKGIMEFLRRGVFKKGYQDGAAGMMEAIIQGINRILVYAQVWELQQKPSIAQRYQNAEEKIAQQWKD